MTYDRAAFQVHQDSIPRNSEGRELCFRCGSPVPDDRRVSYHHPDIPNIFWGPFCSDECACYIKICSGCNHQFVLDAQPGTPKSIKYFNNGQWFCQQCADNLDLCSECGKDVNKDTLIKYKGKKYCPICFNKKFFKCSCNCSSEYQSIDRKAKKDMNKQDQARYDAVFQALGEDICKSCFNKHKDKYPIAKVSECISCGEIAATSRMKDGYCPACIKRGSAKKCDKCNHYHHQIVTKGSHKQSHRKDLCPKCVDSVRECETCGITSLGRQVIQTNGFLRHSQCTECAKLSVECPTCLSSTNPDNLQVRGSYKVCPRCNDGLNFYELEDGKPIPVMGESFIRTKNDSGYKVMSYGYKPYTIFNHTGDPTDRIFFGFENEISYTSEEDRRLALKYIYDNTKSTEVYVKSDSTIDNYGFEVVSHPMNLSFFNNFSLLPLFIVKARTQTRSCGLHVHLSRTSFESKSHLIKLIKFFQDLPQFTTKIGGRDYNSYANAMRDKPVAYAKRGRGGERYNCVNLNNRNTVEVRLFSCAYTDYMLRYRIEFLHSLIEFTRNASLLVGKEVDYVRWLKKQNGYINIKKFIRETFPEMWNN